MQTDEQKKPFDTVNGIIAYECGELSEEDTVEFFQELINSGLCWQLQGHYGRTAMHLIKTGWCTEKQDRVPTFEVREPLVEPDEIRTTVMRDPRVANLKNVKRGKKK